MSHAVGVDLVEVRRIARVVERFGSRFLHRVYTADELAYCGVRAPALAARFAAKEAVAKALGTGIGAVAFREIEVRRAESGAPSMLLHGRARGMADERGFGHIAISLCHTREHAIAFVVCESDP